jgi:putative radical SAM enzyme (TIGR03279 family)
MSEIRVLKPPGALRVVHVDPGSPAERAGILPGDLLREINGRSILDILDYQFHSAEPRLNVLLERSGERIPVRMLVPDGQTPGLTFEHDLGDKIHTCSNKCVFCFIHQMPKKMRKTLYLMDDDFRLSFMHGNYVTLTNLSDAEWARILEQRLSPLYVSVHATDPEVRGALLGKRGPTPILPQLRQLNANRIDVHAQIVLCPTLNDGDILRKTVDELADLHPAATGLRQGVLSVAVVPVGITKFRERLPKLTTADRDYAAAMIDEFELRSRELKRRLGTRFVWLSDEWYHLSERQVPPASHYEDFPQLEDGIGTVRLYLDELDRLAARIPDTAHVPVSATLVTAELPAAQLHRTAEVLNSIEGVDVNVCVVQNDFFGGGINIAGLLTAKDIREALRRFPAKQVVYLPEICLRDGTLFLDDVTVAELREETGLDIRIVEPRPRALFAAMGLARRAPKRQTVRWAMEAPV